MDSPQHTLPALFASRAMEAEVLGKVIRAVAAGVQEGGQGEGGGEFAPWAVRCLQGLQGTKAFATSVMLLDEQERGLVRGALQGLARACPSGGEAAAALPGLREAWGVQ